MRYGQLTEMAVPQATPAMAGAAAKDTGDGALPAKRRRKNPFPSDMLLAWASQPDE